MYIIKIKKDHIFGQFKYLKIDINQQYQCFKYLYVILEINKYILYIIIQLFNKDIDPYWDPPCLQLLGITFLSL